MKLLIRLGPVVGVHDHDRLPLRTFFFVNLLQPLRRTALEGLLGAERRIRLLLPVHFFEELQGTALVLMSTAVGFQAIVAE